MKILITGAKGFVGKNLCCNLRNIMEGKNRTRPGIAIEAIFEYDIDTDPALLDEYCAQADFVFNLAGVNRPKENSEFMAGDQVLTSGRSGLYPSDLVVGYIEEVRTDPSGMTRYAVVAPETDRSDLQQVFVITSFDIVE